MKSRGLLRLLLAATACLVVMTVAFYLIANWRGRTAWDAYEKEATRRGVSLSLTTYIPPGIPDADNFASIPLFQKILAASAASASEPDVFGDSHSVQRTRAFLDQNPHQPAKNKLLLPGRPTENATSDIQSLQFADLSEWKKYLIRAKLLPAVPHAAPADAVLQFLEQYEPEMSQLREAAKRPSCRFSVDWSRGTQASLPHLSALIHASQINALRLEAHLAQGDRSAAYEDLRFGLRLARAVEREPLLLSGLVYMAVIQAPIAGIWRGLNCGIWDDAMLREIQAELATVRVLENYTRAISSERGGFNDVFRKIRGSGSELRQFLAGGAVDKNLVDFIAFLIPAGWWYDNQVACNRSVDALLAEVDVERELYRPNSALRDWERYHTGSTLHQMHFAMHSMFVSSVANATRKYVQTHVRLKQAQIACALDRYRQANGEYPDELDSLVPVYLSAIPNDLMDRAPMRYHTEPGARFVLYSVGDNQEDNGGKFDPKARPYKQLDWVWTYPPTMPAPPAP